ncbi:HigA family addiction module antitoxin [Labilibaculum sp.]|uniref:HigA family addiction module antitoxin n=1 Tax=Labilibaculum sp. TaxID=2060723 RepID=UPI002AA72AC1|nr:HigA family addiction module antitoxin [Labilibaculum sp.]
MKTIDELTPFIPTHAGEVLQDELIANNISIEEFAKLINIKKSQLNRIITGKEMINKKLANKFEKVLGIDSDYWLSLQNKYITDKINIARF